MYRIPSVKVQLVKDGSVRVESRPIIRTPDDVATIMQPLCECHCEEHFYALIMSSKNHVNAIQEVSVGSLSAAIAHPREVFKAAILSNGAAIILVHNHPSGDSVPSPEDIDLTKKMVDAGKLLDIPVLDHVIIGDRRYCSLKEKGVL